MTMEEPRRYLAYLLRLWKTDEEVGSIWRASLESPHSGEHLGFTDLKALFAFLEEETGFIVRRDDCEGGPQ